MPVPGAPGKAPDVPLELPRRLLRAAAGVLVAAVVAVAAVGAWRAGTDTDDEVAAAWALALTLQHLSASGRLGDAELLAAMDRAQAPGPLRHLRLALLDAQGRLRWGERPVEAPDRPHPRAWPVPRPDGQDWTVLIGANPDSEHREAQRELLVTLALFSVGAIAVLLLMRRQLRRSLQPLQDLVAAIEHPRPDGTWPVMPVRELQLLSDALRRAQDQRDRLGRRLQTLQEQERRWLAQELHDELGQRLTALRLDAAVLQRRAAPELAALADGIAGQAAAAQDEVRSLLARLAPRAGDGDPARLRELLQDLADAQRGLEVRLSLDLGDTPLPDALAMAVYRLSQEGLTNVSRHAGARQAWLELRRQDNHLRWQLRDDGRGLRDVEAAFQRGSGLAGMRERAWAWGADLAVDTEGPGLALAADLQIEAPA